MAPPHTQPDDRSYETAAEVRHISHASDTLSASVASLPSQVASQLAPQSASDTRPLTERLEEAARTWASSQHSLIVLAAEFADSVEWVLAGAPTAAHWLAEVADIETCTAREWIRIGRKLGELTAIADAFSNAEISYSKVRTLTRHASADNEAALLDLARKCPASDLGRAIAYWLKENSSPEELDDLQRQQRSVKWRTEPDGMVLFTMRLQPVVAGMLIALLTTLVMRSKPRKDNHKATAPDAWPTSAQQHADALERLLTDGPGSIDTELIVHVRGDGATLDDGTPVNDSAVAKLLSKSLIRALIHDSESNPIDATNRRRHPTARQKRLVKERDQHCVECGRTDLLQYDHQPAYEETGHTITTELKLLCAPCHHKRHAEENG